MRYQTTTSRHQGFTWKTGYTLKIRQEDYVTGFKARWVVCGNRQRFGIDFDENYAPVATDQTIKLFLCLVAVKGLVTRQFDVVPAYLNGKLRDHQVYIRQPTRFAGPVRSVY